MRELHLTGSTPQTWSFGEFTLDLIRGSLLRGETEIKLRPKSFELLKYLVLRSGRLVAKGELLQTLWPDTNVGDDAVAHCLMEVRRALGDAGPEMVKTVPGRGYIFEAVISSVQPPRTGQKPNRVIALSTRLRLLAVAALLAVAGAGGLAAWRGIEIRSARQALPQVEALARAGRYLESYNQATAALKYLPNEIRLTHLMPVISDDLNVSSTPPGATVYLKRFSPEQASMRKEVTGKTPISHLRIARGEYVISIELPGYARFERTVSSTLGRSEQPNIISDRYEIHADCRLVKAVDTPNGMVFVPGGDYSLQGWDIPYDGSVRLQDYFVDKFEVSNRQFKEFIDSAGYLNEKFWKHPILRNGKAVPWLEAIAGFKDRTGLPGPRNWSGGTFPTTKDDYPVTDITWYEAAAYACFRGKRLPTIFEWEKTARGGLGRHFRGIMAPWGPFQGDATISRAIFV
jgi:DNA-binding winged helix-turn-helix (wHTH) protein